jgi:hypothetical protein
MIAKKFRELLECSKTALEAYLLKKYREHDPSFPDMFNDSNG